MANTVQRIPMSLEAMVDAQHAEVLGQFGFLNRAMTETVNTTVDRALVPVRETHQESLAKIEDLVRSTVQTVTKAQEINDATAIIVESFLHTTKESYKGTQEEIENIQKAIADCVHRVKWCSTEVVRAREASSSAKSAIEALQAEVRSQTRSLETLDSTLRQLRSGLWGLANILAACIIIGLLWRIL